MKFWRTFFKMDRFIERVSIFIFIVFLVWILCFVSYWFGYMSGNKDGYKLRCKTDLVKKHPELFRDVWQFEVDAISENKWQEEKR